MKRFGVLFALLLISAGARAEAIIDWNGFEDLVAVGAQSEVESALVRYNIPGECISRAGSEAFVVSEVNPGEVVEGLTYEVKMSAGEIVIRIEVLGIYDDPAHMPEPIWQTREFSCSY